MTFPAVTFPDLAARAFGGAVVATNDEFFAAAANLNAPHEPKHDPLTFDERGQIYDGWETRRRREPGHDWAIVRLGAPGVIRSVVVDTAHFAGNYPQSCTVEAAAVDGYPGVTELSAASWTTIVPTARLRGDSAHTFDVQRSRRFTHVRLVIHPDGGVARLRVHGEPVPDPTLLPLVPVDLAATTNGSRVVDCSDEFFSPPSNLLAPDSARVTGEGWETVRRRDDGNDWVIIALATEGRLALAEVDTRPFIGNAPARIRLRDQTRQVDLLPESEVQPNGIHRFVVSESSPVSTVRLDIFPDGGLGRLRLYGTPTDRGLRAVRDRWDASRG